MACSHKTHPRSNSAGVTSVGLGCLGLIGLLCSGLLLFAWHHTTDRPDIGSMVVVVVDPASAYTDGDTVLVADNFHDYDELGKCIRAHDSVGAERIKDRGSALRLAPGDRLRIMGEVGMVGGTGTFLAKVRTGPHIGREVYVDQANFKLTD